MVSCLFRREKITGSSQMKERNSIDPAEISPTAMPNFRAVSPLDTVCLVRVKTCSPRCQPVLLKKFLRDIVRMPGVPSNKACERCKKRHLKCDETRPHCRRCKDAGIDCPGFVQTRKFIDQGASVRRRYAPYQEHAFKPANGRSTPQTGTNQVPETSAGDGNALEPQGRSAAADPLNIEIDDLSFSHGALNLDSGNSTPSAIDHGMADVTSRPGGNPQPGAVSRQSSDSRVQQAPPATGITSAGEPTNFQNTAPSYYQENRFARRPSQGEREEFQDIFSDFTAGTEHETAFLVRHYCEVLASWFDISDGGKFFSACVPVRAIGEESLRYASAAVAAKHLAKMKGVKPTAASGMFTSPSTMETYPNATQVDWTLKAANYYYLSVSRMNSAVSDYAAVSSSDVLDPPIGVVNRWLSLQLRRTEEQPNTMNEEIWRQGENLLASSAILTLYKVLEEPGEKWQSYLTGVKQLFGQLLELLRQGIGHRTHFPHGVSASFWNFARLDFLASYYNRLPTLLDPDDFDLWRAAGLPLDDPNDQTSALAAKSQVFLGEEIAANTLTRLLNKLTNFLAASKKSQVEHWVGHPLSEPSPSQSRPDSPDSHPTSATWIKLTFEFQAWVERIPETFRPCLRLEKPRPTANETAPMPFPEIFYSLPTCAAAMQQYHFGRLALSLNEPSDDISAPSTAFDRLQSYREVTKVVEYRCREICGIALGRPQSGARVQMITTLYAVGQCMEKPEERQIVVDLLRGIEADLGWSTAVQVQKLQR